MDLHRLSTADLGTPDIGFTDGGFRYVTSGRKLGGGGMGAAWLVTRESPSGQEQIMVAKTFREEFLAMLREDEVARRHFDHFERLTEEMRTLQHPNVLPVVRLAPIEDNYLLITPLAGESLLQTVAKHELSPRERVYLYMEALKGLEALHARGIVHRDFTLHNILTTGDTALVFDFDVSVCPSLLPEELRTWGHYYEGRVLGSPEFSIAPELLDDILCERRIEPSMDVYACGTGLYSLFADGSVYGDPPDLPSLFERIKEGVVHRRKSRIQFDEKVPPVLWPILETCLERDPDARYADASVLLKALEPVLAALSEDEIEGPAHKLPGGGVTQVNWSPEELYDGRPDASVTLEEIMAMEKAMAGWGYLVDMSLGRVKGHAIYRVVPDPELVAQGAFPDDHNAYPKIVTAIDLAGRADADDFVETWLSRIQPILTKLRKGFLTALYRAVHDRQAKQLLLFSENVDDPRFGGELADHALTLEEVFGLGLIVAHSIARLHEEGLAHNNVEADSLVLKGLRDTGRVLPLFVGLVEPSFHPVAQFDDVQRLAAIVGGWLGQARTDLVRPELTEDIERMREELGRIGRAESSAAVTIQVLVHRFSRALGLLDRNFALVQQNGGDTAAYADLLVRHSLYARLFLREPTPQT